MWDFFTNLWSSVVDIVDICVGYVKNGVGVVRDTAVNGWEFTSICAKSSWMSCKATWPISKAKAILGGFLALVGVACIGISMGVVLVGVLPIAIFFGGAYILLNMKANSNLDEVLSQAEAV